MYKKAIKKICPNHNPRHIEAQMRLEFKTLDHLSAKRFKEEVLIAGRIVDLDPELAERLAKSYGM